MTVDLTTRPTAELLAEIERRRGLIRWIERAEELLAECRRLTGRRRRPWSPADRAVLRAGFRRLPAERIGRLLDRPVHQVYQAAYRLGLSWAQAWDAASMRPVIAARNAAGWPDSEIARELRVDRHAVARARREMGLPSNARSAWVRDRVRAATAAQCRAAGVANLGALRAKVLAGRSAAMGWPANLPWRAGQILTLLWERGPLTRRQIVEGLRPDIDPATLTPRRIDKAMMDNARYGGSERPNSYLANLMRRGLVISLGRRVQDTSRPIGRRQGHNVCLYSLPLTLQRRTADAG